MNSMLRTAARWSPLVMIGFLAVAVVQLDMQAGISAAGIARWLRALAPAYVVAAAAGWTLAAAGLAFEAWAGPRPREKGRGAIMDVLQRLTNRAALEAMLEQQPPVIVDAEALARHPM